MELVAKIAGTAGIISVMTTVIANFLTLKDYTEIIKTFKGITIVCAGFLAVYFLPAIWFEELDGYVEDTWRLIAIVGILFVFGAIVTPILVKVAKGKLNKATPTVVVQQVDEAKLRQEIEAQVRAEIVREQQAGQTESPAQQTPPQDNQIDNNDDQ
jgi:hypothetical protein